MGQNERKMDQNEGKRIKLWVKCIKRMVKWIKIWAKCIKIRVKVQKMILGAKFKFKMRHF